MFHVKHTKKIKLIPVSRKTGIIHFLGIFKNKKNEKYRNIHVSRETIIKQSFSISRKTIIKQSFSVSRETNKTEIKLFKFHVKQK